jgi:excisionase family DNA binding protein
MVDIVSTKSVASLLGVSEATVKRWADAGVLRCFRTRGGHRKFRLKDVRAFLNDEPLPPQGENGTNGTHATNGTSGTNGTHGTNGTNGTHAVARSTPPPPAPIADGAKRAAAFALAGDVDGLVSLATQARDGGSTLADMFDALLAPALRVVGDRWACGDITVAQEHIASNTVSEMLARLRPIAQAAGATRTERPKALCACLGEERHDLAVRMVALVLTEQGYEPMLAGGYVPAIDLARLVAQEKPSLVALSASANADGDALRGDLAVIASAATTARAKVIVGGAGFGKLDRLPVVVARYASIADFAT